MFKSGLEQLDGKHCEICKGLIKTSDGEEIYCSALLDCIGHEECVMSADRIYLSSCGELTKEIESVVKRFREEKIMSNGSNKA